MEKIPLSDLQKQGLMLEQKALSRLHTTGKWAHFIAVLGFVVLGLILIMPLTLYRSGPGSVFHGFSPYALIPSLAFGLVYFFPVYFLYRFARLTKHAINTMNNVMLAKALLFQKLHYIMLGVLAIVAIGIYLVLMAGIMLGASLF